MPAWVLITKTGKWARMKWVTCGLVSSWLGVREITGGWSGSIFFFGRGWVISFWRENEIVEVDLVRGGDGLILLSDGRDRRQLVLLLMLSIEPSLWAQGSCLRAQVRRRRTSTMTKDAWVLNASATKFEVPSHMSEREELSEARAGTRDLSRGGSLRGLG